MMMKDPQILYSNRYNPRMALCTLILSPFFFHTKVWEVIIFTVCFQGGGFLKLVSLQKHLHITLFTSVYQQYLTFIYLLVNQTTIAHIYTDTKII